MCNPPHGLDLHCVAAFLDAVEAPDLATWLGVPPDVSGHALRKAIDDRRRWAQGHQANPRHRDEALWIIRHRRRLVATLVDGEAALPRIEAEVRSIRRQRLAEALRRLDAGDGGPGSAPPPPGSSPPDLPTVTRGLVAAGRCPGLLDDRVRLYRSLGLTDDQIALLLLDEWGRPGDGRG